MTVLFLVEKWLLYWLLLDDWCFLQTPLNETDSLSSPRYSLWSSALQDIVVTPVATTRLQVSELTNAAFVTGYECSERGLTVPLLEIPFAEPTQRHVLCSHVLSRDLPRKTQHELLVA